MLDTELKVYLKYSNKIPEFLKGTQAENIGTMP